MPAVRSNTETGLSYFATCDCVDFKLRSEAFSEMTQEQINSRWDKAREKLSIQGIWSDIDIWGARVIGGSEVHGVYVCKSDDSPGPNFLCKHCMCALALILKEMDNLEVSALGRPDTELPFGAWETISIDGWLVALVKERKERDE